MGDKASETAAPEATHCFELGSEIVSSVKSYKTIELNFTCKGAELYLVDSRDRQVYRLSITPTYKKEGEHLAAISHGDGENDGF